MDEQVFSLPLPPGYRCQEVLAFHGRDPQARAEKVCGQMLVKAVVVAGKPCVVRIGLGTNEARCQVSSELAPSEARAMVSRLLGLNWDSPRFEAAVAGQPPLAGLVAARRGLVIPMAATPFEALSWAVTGQQINLTVAAQLRRRLVERVGREAGADLLCYPGAQDVAALSPEQLGALGYSRAKARALMAVSELACAGQLPLDRWLAEGGEPGEISAALLAVPGIGPWTVNYTLLRGFGCPDCSLHGDVAVRNALQRLLNIGQRPSVAEAQRWLAQHSPWRSLVAAHLWAMLTTLAE